jgi:uroporphyrinogen-III decarboxylase
MISPDLYRALSLPQIRDYVDVLHAQGKKAVLHMCGHIRELLEPIRETGLDGINAATPPPIGNTSCEDVLDFFGDDFLLFGGVFDPSVLHKADVSSAELQDYLTRLYTPRLRKANLVLWLAVDGLTTPLQRFLAVGQWMRGENPS